eukprot:748743-Hanusia_phi.AAC.1
MMTTSIPVKSKNSIWKDLRSTAGKAETAKSFHRPSLSMNTTCVASSISHCTKNTDESIRNPSFLPFGKQEMLYKTSHSLPALCPTAFHIFPDTCHSGKDMYTHDFPLYVPGKAYDGAHAHLDFYPSQESRNHAITSPAPTRIIPVSELQTMKNENQRQTTTVEYTDRFLKYPTHEQIKYKHGLIRQNSAFHHITARMQQTTAESISENDDSASSSQDSVDLVESDSDEDQDLYDYDDGNSELFAHVTLRRKHHEDLRTRDSIVLDSTTVASYFHMRQSEAAAAFGISLTAFKSACRKIGIQRWPYMRRAAASAQTAETEADVGLGRAQERRDSLGRKPAAAAAQKQQAGRAGWGSSHDELMEEALEHCMGEEGGLFMAGGKGARVAFAEEAGKAEQLGADLAAGWATSSDVSSSRPALDLCVDRAVSGCTGLRCLDSCEALGRASDC